MGKRQHGKYLLHQAVKNGDLAQVRSLIKQGLNVNQKDNLLGYSPLHYAIGKPQIAELLLNAGADVNALDKTGEALLHRAAAAEDGLALTKLLLKHGADIHLRGSHGQGVLHYACAFGTLQTAKYLIKAKANPLEKTKKKQSNLHLAAHRAELSLLKFFLDLKVSVNDRDIYGRTPLHVAAMPGYASHSNAWLGEDFFDDQAIKRERKEHIAAIRLLMNHKADKKMKDKYGKTAYDYAVKNSFVEASEILA